MKSGSEFLKTLLIGGVLALCISGSAANANVIGLRVNGFYCNLCIGGSITQLKAAAGVQNVKVWIGSGLIWISPGNVNLSPLVEIINNSSYKLQGIWSCAQPTTNLSSCKKVS